MEYLAVLGTLAVIYLLYILARLSERLGSVEKMAPLYRYYYAGAGFITIALVTQIVTARAELSSGSAPAWLFSTWFTLVLYHLPMAIGVTIGLLVSWRYWSWLITHQEK